MEENELIDICKEYNLNAQKKIIKEVSEKFLTMNDKDWLKIFIDGGYDNDPVIRKTIVAFSAMYNILIDKGIATFNPFDSELLSVGNIVRIMELNTYITPQELEEKLCLLGSARTYAECFPRLVYEGLYEYKDFYGMKKHDVDFDNKKIYLPDFTIEMSDELARAMSNHSQASELNKMSVDHTYIGSFIKTIKPYPDENNIKCFINVISQYIGVIELKKLHLYGSGFINYLYKELSCSMKKLDEIFFDNLEHRGLVEDLVKEIEEYGREYGIKLEGKLIRYKYKKYYKSFKYKMKNTKPD